MPAARIGPAISLWLMRPSFAPTAPALTLVHRRQEFRAAPASVARMRELEAAGRLRFIEGLADGILAEGDRLT
ncbi:MAG: hypothetical protein ACOVOA_00735, partial [Allorhizobium sp.]